MHSVEHRMPVRKSLIFSSDEKYNAIKAEASRLGIKIGAFVEQLFDTQSSQQQNKQQE